MRYICLKVNPEDREKIEKRRAGDEKLKDGLFGEVELIRKLLEVSPKVMKMDDVTRLLRITRKLEKIEDQEHPILEIPDDEWEWVKGILNHEKYGTYGPQFMRTFGELLEAILEAKCEPPSKLHINEKEAVC